MDEMAETAYFFLTPLIDIDATELIDASPERTAEYRPMMTLPTLESSSSLKAIPK